jgi:hypothetical protein
MIKKVRGREDFVGGSRDSVTNRGILQAQSSLVAPNELEAYCANKMVIAG